LGLKNVVGGAKRDSRKRGKMVKPGGFPEGVPAVVTYPGLLEASEEPREVRTGMMKGNLILGRIGADRYSFLYDMKPLPAIGLRPSGRKIEKPAIRYGPRVFRL
jgi:hypothetical protein